MPRLSRHRLWLIIQRVLLFAGLWLVLTGGVAAALPYGALLVVLATWMSIWLLPVGGRRRMGFGAVWLLPMFMLRAIGGGVDVARRALLPGQNLEPAMVKFPLRHREGGVPILMAYILAGLPGSLTIDIEDGHIILHVLDPAMATPEMVAELERKVETVLGQEPTHD